MRIVVLDTWPCEPSLGGERFQGLTATASTGDQLGERAVIASPIVARGVNGLPSSGVDRLDGSFQRFDPRCPEGARSRPRADDIDGYGDAACHNSMVEGKTDQAARSPVPGQRS